jgi:two-component system chemotaxis sensor kinase CheA
VLEEIKDPLIHLLRNSVDHGIEPPDQRVAVGKPARGTITLSACQKGNSIVIEVSDDGAGIDVAKVKKSAVKAGLITAEEAHAMNDDEAMRLIFLPGLSTSETITDISGRGVGMDVVRKNVEALQGQVDVDSVLGWGTKVTLTLPLTLATTLELLVQVGGHTYGLPISAVERILRINVSDIASMEGKEAIAVGGEPISLVHLADVLELDSEKAQAQEVKADQKIPVVIVSSAKKRVAFVVDAVVGQQESVVKGLGKQLARVRNVAGATILGTGQVIMTLNPTDLVTSARAVEGRASKLLQAPPTKVEEQRKPTILVVDDSLTTRTLEKNILETAGYEVKVANDGAEALSILQAGDCDLVVSDVLMPRMTGLELTEAIKGNPRTKDIPVVLVTSLESREDRERGVEVGADAYIVKSSFDQANLLQTIEQLL